QKNETTVMTQSATYASRRFRRISGTIVRETTTATARPIQPAREYVGTSAAAMTALQPAASRGFHARSGQRATINVASPIDAERTDEPGGEKHVRAMQPPTRNAAQNSERNECKPIVWCVLRDRDDRGCRKQKAKTGMGGEERCYRQRDEHDRVVRVPDDRVSHH